MSTPRKSPGRSRKGSRRSRSSGRFMLWRWLLGIAVVVVVAGIGLLKWVETRPGRAALLTLGSDKMYSEVQTAVEQALVTVLPNMPTGPASGTAGEPGDSGEDLDWPVPRLGPGAAIRCRIVPVSGSITWWDLQQRVAAALDLAGARVLWGQRLYPARPGTDQIHPNEDKDLLRLDVGVTGRPTHTLMLYRQGTRPVIRWGDGQALTRWESLTADPRPTIALVIDDWGNNTKAAASAILALDIPVTMSVLPGRPFSRHFALMGTELILPPKADSGEIIHPGTAGTESAARRLAAGCPVEVQVGSKREPLLQRRREIILHLPMEPQGYPDQDPGPGALMVGMGAHEIEDLLDQDLKGLPHVAGLNNHMGSAATSDEKTMATLMGVLKKRDLFFLDSLTTARSVAYREARRAGVPALRNRTFLDYDLENPEQIRANLEVLVAAARKSGFAVGIGHPHPRTAEVLMSEIPRLQRQGIRFVTLSEMIALQRAATGTKP